MRFLKISPIVFYLISAFIAFSFACPSFADDHSHPSASISYSPSGPYKLGDTVTITANFSEPMAVTPVTHIAISAVSGGSGLSATDMTRVSSTSYTYTFTVGSGSGTANVSLSSGTDLSGNSVTTNPTSGGSFTVIKTPATVALANLSQTYNGNPKSATAITTPPNLAAQYTYNGSTTAPTSAGSYAVIATINDPSYQGTASGTLVIAKAPQSITFPSISTKHYGDADFDMNATITSGLDIAFTTDNPSVASITGPQRGDDDDHSHYTGHLVHISGVGSATITASQAGDNNYLPASAQQSFNVSRAVITVTADNKSRNFGSANPAFTATYSGFVNGDRSSVITGSPTFTTTATSTSPAGSYPITPDVSGLSAANYSFRGTNGTLTIGQNNQTINFNSLAAKTYGDANFNLSATGGASGNPITYASSDTNVASVSGTTVTIKGAGTTTITASQTGTAQYSSATAQQVLTVNKALITVTADNKSRGFGAVDPVFTATYSGFVTGENSSIISGTPTFTTTATITSPTGSYTITPDVSSLSAVNYTFRAANGTLAVGLTSQTITFNPISAKTYGDAPFDLSATGGASGNPITFTSSNTSVAMVNGATVTIKGAGSTTITANQAGGSSYSSASAQQVFTVNKALLTVTASNASRAYNATDPVFSVVYSGFVNSENQGVLQGAPAISTTATLASPAGTYPISPTIGSLVSANYAFGFVNGTLTINQAVPLITWGNPSPIIYGLPLSATQLNASTSIPGSITYNPPLGALLNAGAGQILTANFTPADRTNYAPVSKNVTIDVGLAGQTIGAISFSPNSLVVCGTTTASATATSGLAVTFSSATPGVCTVTAATVTAVTAGTCTITASQPGNTNFNAATQVTQNITIGGTITSCSSISVNTYTVSASAGSGGTISPATPQSVNNNATTSVTVIPATGYSIAAVSGCNGNLNGSIYTTGPISEACTITATFSPNRYGISFTSSGNGSLAGAISQTVNFAANAASVTAAPIGGYHFVNWTGSGGFTSTSNPLTVTNVTSNMNIVANFAQDLDITPPMVNTFALPSTATNLTVSVIHFTASDNIGVSGYLLSESPSQPALNNPAWSPTAPTSYTFATQGSRTLYAFAKDASGNISAALPSSVTIILPDTTPPTVGSFSLPAAATSLTVQVLSFTATDNAGVAGYLLSEVATQPSANDSAWSPTPPVSYTFATQGSRTLYAFAKDASGNISAALPSSVTIILSDTTPPTVDSFSLPATATSLTVPVLSFTATDNVGVAGYLLSEVATQPSTRDPAWTPTVPASYVFATQGARTLYAFAKDTSGNISSAVPSTVTISLPDTTPPTVDSFSLPATATSLTVPIQSFTASDNVEVTGYLLSEVASVPDSRNPAWTVTPPASYTFGTQGVRTLFAFAKDASGNVSATITATVTITLPDTTLPSVDRFALPATATSLTVPVLSFSASDIVGIADYLLKEVATPPDARDPAWTPTPSASYTFTTQGVKTLYAFAKDNAGNISPAATAAIIISLPDTVPPIVDHFVLPATSANLTVSISAFSASDNVGVSGYLLSEAATLPDANNPAWSPTPLASYTFSAQGVKTLYAFAKDAAGNISSPLSATLTITLPHVAITINSLDNGSYGTSYTHPLAATGGTTPYTWSVISGTLPPGLALSGNVINGTPIQAGSYSFTIQAADMSTPVQAVAQTYNITIDKAVLIVTAPNTSRAYGASDPTYSANYTGFVNGDSASMLSGSPILSTTASATSPTGVYDIIVGPGTLAATNYSFLFVNGTLTVTGLPLTVVTSSLRGGVYGQSYSQSLLASGGVPPYTWSASAGSLPPGLSLSGDTIIGTPTQAGSYSFSVQVNDAAAVPTTTSRDFSVTIDKATLTVTAASTTKTAGTTNPTLTASYSGFVNGDTASILSGIPTVTTTATTTSSVGSYDITVSQGTLTAFNYRFSFVNGTLGVTDMVVGSDGQTGAPILLATTSGSQIGIAASTRLLDASGNPVSGSLTITSTDMRTISALPSAAASSGTSDGASLVSLAASIDLVLSVGGTMVKTINPPMTVSLAVPSAFATPGATVQYYSFDGTKWTTEGSAAIKTDGSVDMLVGHLSIWAVGSFKQLPKGDVNSDGKVDLTDAMRVMRIAAGLITPTANDLANGDVAPLVDGRPSVTRKGYITAGDATVVMQKALGIVNW